MKDDIDFLNNTVWCKLSASPIHGVGVFAIRDIPKGTFYTDYNIFKPMEFRTFKMSVEELNQLVPEVRDLIIDKTSFPKHKEILPFHSPNHEASLMGFMNHSSTPNTDGIMTLVDIKKGEELTEDYNKMYKEGLHDINIKNFDSTNV